MVWRFLKSILIRCWSFFEGRVIVIPDFDENDPGAEHPLYVKNKDEVLESWKYESK